jgi:hypothetical protein
MCHFQPIIQLYGVDTSLLPARDVPMAVHKSLLDRMVHLINGLGQLMDEAHFEFPCNTQFCGFLPEMSILLAGGSLTVATANQDLLCHLQPAPAAEPPAAAEDVEIPAEE